MPGFIRTKGDEARWQKAKEAANKNHSDSEGDSYWKIVNSIYQNMTKEEDEPVLKTSDSDYSDSDSEDYDLSDEDDPFEAYKHWGAADTRKPGVHDGVPSKAPSEAPKKEAISVPKRKPGTPFTPEEINKLRDLAGKQAANIIISRNHYSDPSKNPKLYREAQLQLAHEGSFGPLHRAWEQFRDSDTYRDASLPQKWRMQHEFLKNWHEQNPEHYSSAMNSVHTAHAKGFVADKKRDKEEMEKLKHIISGGGTGKMTGAEAAAHLGVKGGSDDLPAVSTFQSAGSQFAGHNIEAAKRALESKRFKDMGDEDIPEVEALTSRPPIHIHPDLAKPENKALVNDFASRYAHLQSGDFVNKLKNTLGVTDSNLDEAQVSDAANNAMWMALHKYNAARSPMPLDKFIKQSMIYAMKHNMRQQYASSVGTAAKKEADRTRLADPKRTEGVKHYSPEEIAEMNAKMLGQQAPASTPAQPAAPQSTGEESKPKDFKFMLDAMRNKRLAHIDSAKAAPTTPAEPAKPEGTTPAPTIIRRPGGTK